MDGLAGLDLMFSVGFGTNFVILLLSFLVEKGLDNLVSNANDLLNQY